MTKCKQFLSEGSNEYDITHLTLGEKKILTDIWEMREQYECIDYTKIPLLVEYAKIFCLLQNKSDAMKNGEHVDIADYVRLQKIVLDYRKILQLDKLKPRSKNRWADILLKRG